MKTKPFQLLFDAMYHGKYEFQDFLHGEVAANYDRAVHKGRSIYRPNKKLKAYHAFLNTFLCEYLLTNNRVVYSYRKGIKPHEAVLAHAASRAFFQTDIENFFGSIDRNLVQSTFLHRGAAAPVTDLHEHVERILDLTTVDGALPIGFSTSPPISNACLTDFDNDLEAKCVEEGLIYTRYADDIVISSQDRQSLFGINDAVGSLLVKHFAERFKLNPAKSKLTSTGRKIKILGMVVLPSGQVAVNMELKKRIEVLLHFYVRDKEKFLDYVKNDMEAGIEQLSGYINYINSADASYLEKLRKKFGSTVIDSLIHRSAK